MRFRLAMVAGICLGLGGCHGAAVAPAAAKPYAVRGQVVSVNAGQQEISLKSEEIPGYMAPMTMEYKVTDPAAVQEIHAGDTISAKLLDGGGDLKLADVAILTQAQPDYKPAVQYHVPAVGDAVPDFKLLDQSGRTIGVKQFRGKVVLMTFIYTRCPLSDYCPRMSRNFAEIDKALAADPAVYAKTHLLSVSFDPKNDTPKVLKSYGAAYTGRYVKETFDHWEFAAPPVGELAQMEQWFDVGVTPGESGTLQHSLSTVLLGRDGKVVAFWPSNDWTVQDVVAKVKAVAE